MIRIPRHGLTSGLQRHLHKPGTVQPQALLAAPQIGRAEESLGHRHEISGGLADRRRMGLDHPAQPDSLDKETFFAQCGEVSKGVFDIVQRYGGSVSAEHGVGLLKKDYLGYSRSAQEVALMKQVKQVFDPNGVMNPGKIFD